MKRIFTIVMCAAMLVSVMAVFAGCEEDTTPTQSSTTTTTTAVQSTTTVKNDEMTTTTQPPTTTTTTIVTTTKKPTTTTTISTEDFPDESLWDTINDAKVYTSENGGVQITVKGWGTYNLFGTMLVPSEEFSPSWGGDFIGCAKIHVTSSAPGQTEPNIISPVLGFNPNRTFSAAQKKKFNTDSAWNITGMYVDFDYFDKTTISSRGKTYTCYKYAYDDTYYWTFQTDYYIYTIYFADATSKNAYPDYDMKEVGEEIMKTIVIYY